MYLEAFEAAHKAGISLTVTVPVVGGSQEMSVTPLQALRFLNDSNGARAELLGMAANDYAEYVASQGTVYCQGTASRGRPCRNSVPGMTLLRPEHWLKARKSGGYCSAHGE